MRLLRTFHGKNNQGQSILELAMILILVMVGIVVAGPYVLRSIHGHFKLWDEAVQDSFDDRIVRATKEQVNITFDKCECQWVPTECGIQGCNSNERLYIQKCNIPQCGWAQECRIENQAPSGKTACCDAPVRTDICWRQSTVVNNSGSTPVPAGFKANCQLGDRVYEYACGNNFGQQVCKQDHTTADNDRDCRPRCLIEHIAHTSIGPVATMCVGDDIGLLDDTGITVVGEAPDSCNKSIPDNKCEAYCNEGFIRDGNKCIFPVCVPSNPSQYFDITPQIPTWHDNGAVYHINLNNSALVSTEGVKANNLIINKPNQNVFFVNWINYGKDDHTAEIPLIAQRYVYSAEIVPGEPYFITDLGERCAHYYTLNTSDYHACVAYYTSWVRITYNKTDALIININAGSKDTQFFRFKLRKDSPTGPVVFEFGLGPSDAQASPVDHGMDILFLPFCTGQCQETNGQKTVLTCEENGQRWATHCEPCVENGTTFAGYCDVQK